MSVAEAQTAACRESLLSLVKIGERLTDADWAKPTECPLWSVADVYAHVVGFEKWITEGLQAFDGPTQDFIDSHVSERRGRSREDVLAEFNSILPGSLAVLAEPPTELYTPIHRQVVPADLAFAVRAFDLYTHEQDVRRAIGRPGNLGSTGGAFVRASLLRSMPRTITQVAGAPAGSVIRITAMGEHGFDAGVTVDESGRGTLAWPWVASGTPTTTHATMSWETFARLGAGRGRDGHEILITGDVTLGERVLTSINVAP